jgi:hypothetical protein
MTTKILATVLLVLAFGSYAGADDKALTPQQQKMKSCNTEAASKGVTGGARKEFMSNCLKSGSPATTAKALTPQQEKMRSCNADAKTKGVQGAARKEFIASCLKSS